MRKRVVTGLAALLSGCVYPADNPTGIEFSWLFHEVNATDGDDARRILTCAGAEVETVAVAATDTSDETRSGVFRFPCEDGFQTPTDVARAASDAFLELHSRSYDLELRVEAAGAAGDLLADRTVKVLSRAITVEFWELDRTGVDWSLVISGADACNEVALSLFYADPETALAEPDKDEEGKVLPSLYREKLKSDRGLGLAGDAVACDQAAATHLFTGIDRGAYRLEIDRGESDCSLNVDIAPGTTTNLDLSNLPCG